MAEKAPGGSVDVRNLRTRFESKQETTSPPSRGRSTATGSEGARSSSSRPLSKVRTSFVAVEKSGQLGPIIGLRKHSDAGGLSTEASDSKVNGLSLGNFRGANNTVAPTSIPDGSGESSLSKVQEEEVRTDEKEGAVENGIQTTTAAPKSSGNHVNPESMSTNSQVGHADTAPTMNQEESGSLGILLKGSPFEPLPKEGGAENTSKATGQKISPVKNSPNSASKPSAFKAAQAKFTPSPSASAKGKSKVEPKSNRPTPISTKAAMQSPKPSPGPQSSRSSKRSVTTPTTSKLNESQTKLASAKQTAPKDLLSKEVELLAANKTKEQISTDGVVGNGKTRRPPRPSESTAATKASSSSGGFGRRSDVSKTSTTMKPASPKASQATKRPTQASPPFVKPAPKSPTRPVRLPVSATAQTASSAAKTGNTSQSRSTNHAPASSVERKPSTLKSSTSRTTQPPGNTKPKASRPSLGPSAAAHERPASRTSTRPADEGFLARMMRPTTSSASKAHEKIEAKSPPGKAKNVRVKRKSEAVERARPKEGDVGSAAESDAAVAGSGAEAVAAETNGLDGGAGGLNGAQSGEVHSSQPSQAGKGGSEEEKGNREDVVVATASGNGVTA